MPDVDVSNIVPSTRDLLQMVATRRRSLALIGVITNDTPGPSADAARLAELNVSAFAAYEPSAALQSAAAATKTVPSLCLAPIRDRDALVQARANGADGVAIDARLPLEDWDKLAKVARSMRMTPIAYAVDEASFAAAVEAGARAVLVHAPSAAEVLAVVAKAPRTVTLVACADTIDADGIRSLASKVDAAVVPPSVHAAPDFAKLVSDVDP